MSPAVSSWSAAGGFRIDPSAPRTRLDDSGSRGEAGKVDPFRLRSAVRHCQRPSAKWAHRGSSSHIHFGFGALTCLNQLPPGARSGSSCLESPHAPTARPRSAGALPNVPRGATAHAAAVVNPVGSTPVRVATKGVRTEKACVRARDGARPERAGARTGTAGERGGRRSDGASRPAFGSRAPRTDSTERRGDRPAYGARRAPSRDDRARTDRARTTGPVTTGPATTGPRRPDPRRPGPHR